MARACELCGSGLPMRQWLSSQTVCLSCLQRRNAARERAKANYRQAILHALRDAVITPQEWQHLAHLRTQTGVLPIDAFNIHREVFQSGHQHVIGDRIVTPQELAYLRNLAAQLRLPPGEVSEKLSDATRLNQLHGLQHGPLPSIPNSPINLQKNEICHWVEPNSAYIEERSQRMYQSGSSGFSFRICKGVSYRVGSSKGHFYSVPHSVHADTGYLVITSKRIGFIGARRSFAIPYSKILSFDTYDNAVSVQKDGVTAKPQIFTVQDTDAVGIVLARAADAAS